MAKTDKRFDTYIAKAPEFARPMLERIRAAHHKASPGIVETVKWSMPHFEQDGIVSGMGAFKAHVSFWLWRGAELEDPTGLFSPRPKAGQSQAKFESLKEMPTQAVLARLIKQAVRANQARASAPKKKAAKKAANRPAPRAPKVLTDALEKNKKAKATFDGFPPSAKRDYIEWISEAKREATRDKRLATAIEWMSEGKRRNWKYERC